MLEKKSIGESKFWNSLWDHYANLPSVAICRVPELEYASTLNVEQSVLDHCCGDGFFASLAWPNKKLTAGCDINALQINQARIASLYRRVDVCDVSKRMPYDDRAFDLVFDNSALEHIENLSGALHEIARVLKPGGRFAFNVLNHRYFEWWPLSIDTQKAYRGWQPFYHALTDAQWRKYLEDSGLSLVSVHGYFEKDSAQRFAKLDYIFSAYYFRKQQSYSVSATNLFKPLAKIYWKRKLAGMTCKTEPDQGAGYFMQAIRTN